MADQANTQMWQRLREESEREYLYFKAWLTCAYVTADGKVDPKGVRHALVRDLPKTAKYLGVTVAELRRVSEARKWNERARAYDEHCMSKVVHDQLDTLEEMRARQHKTISRAMRLLDAGLDAIQDALDIEPNGDCEVCAKYDRLSALGSARLDLPRLMDMVCHYQNLLHGEKTANETVRHEFGDDWDLSKLDDDDIRDLMRIKAKLRASR